LPPDHPIPHNPTSPLCGLPQVVGSILLLALGVTAYYSVWGKNKDGERSTLLGLCVVFGVLLAVLLLLSFANLWDHADLALEAALMLVAALNCLYASYDIYDDTVKRTVSRSDAHKCASMYPCCFPKCVGSIWLLLSIACTSASVYAFMAITTGTKGPPVSVDQMTAAGYAAFVPGPTVLALAMVVAALRALRDPTPHLCCGVSQVKAVQHV
jgi:hypothetical protein